VTGGTADRRLTAHNHTRTPKQLLDFIEAKGKEVTEAIAALRTMSIK
jgi:hypothetical protein